MGAGRVGIVEAHSLVCENWNCLHSSFGGDIEKWLFSKTGSFKLAESF